jgi:hypothetical protein
MGKKKNDFEPSGSGVKETQPNRGPHAIEMAQLMHEHWIP